MEHFLLTCKKSSTAISTTKVDLILGQRKRKGLLEYLVRWKGSDADIRGDSWEPANSLADDYAQALQTFTKSLKTKKGKRSSSRSRKTSRSRSRSSSRSRKAALLKEEAKSRSREQQLIVKAEKVAISEGESLQSTRSSRSRGRIITTDADRASVTKEAIEPVDSKSESNTQHESESRETRSSIMTTRQQLEVQRVHNEQRPVRDDDLKPRSAIWKVADYAVIVLFVLSLIAALFLFLEKFVDLEEFKKQAFPNMSVLKTRLENVQQNLVDLANAGVGRISHAWLYLIEQVKGTEEVKVTASGS